LGLSLSYGIIKNHGGDIWAKSRPGIDTRFVVELPVRSPLDPRALELQSPPSEHPRSALAGLRFLLVDDEPVIHDMMALFFAKNSAELAWTCNGKEALNLIQKRRDFDLVFCDILMPEMDGITLYNELKRREHPIVDRFVFLTGDATREHTVQFLQESGRPYLLKPFALNTLRELLIELLPAESKAPKKEPRF
ncbi:MAG: response regulator, partial [bacterium]